MPSHNGRLKRKSPFYATPHNPPNHAGFSMCRIVSLNAKALMKRPWWLFWKRQEATPRRPLGGTNKTPAENFRSMKLLKKEMVVDRLGRWWSIETRQDLATGLILREKRRVTD